MSHNTSLNIPSQFNSVLQAYVEERITAFDSIPEARKDELMQVVRYIRERVALVEATKLTFICTHNSRRSQFAQIWAHVGSLCYRIPKLETFSGGTEVTEFNPSAIAALRRAGLIITAHSSEVANPKYGVRTSHEGEPLICFSKIYDSPPNPGQRSNQRYCAIMTCSHADEGCPVVHGCDFRIPIRYEDPKIADGTESEALTYDLRCAQISTEMLYLMSLV